MSTNLQPALSDIADLFTWKTTQTLTTNVVGTAGQFATDNVKTLNNAFFCFVAWRGSTNYDPVQQFRAALTSGNATALYPAAVPNNFEAFVRRNNRYNMMDQAMPQAALCSTGYRAGQQVPVPILYPPLTTFNFTIYHTAEVLLTEANQSTAKNLRVDFGLFGYNVPAANLGIFMNSWPELYGIAMKSLTGLTVPAP